MSREPNIIDDEALFNVIKAGGLVSPGVVTLSGHDRSVKWDVKSADRTSGATTTYVGEDPTEFEASFYLADVEQFSAWAAFRDMLSASYAKPNKAIDVYHPDLAANKISAVVVRKIGGPVNDGKGGRTVKVTFLEFRPPQKKSGTPNGSRTKKPDPNAAALAELDRLRKEYERTPWG